MNKPLDATIASSDPISCSDSATSVAKVSVVIPVYNTESYLEHTLRSIMNQTLREIEIWVIDDGSTDRSAEIATRLSHEDARIHVVSQANSGPSIARNRGIALATGTYIYFMDSDDLLEADTLACCYQRGVAEDLDVIFFDAVAFSDDAVDLLDIRYQRTTGLTSEVRGGLSYLTLLLREQRYLPSPCLCLVRTDLLHQHQIRFYPGILHEDELYTPQLYLYAQRVSAISRTFFHRRMRPNSIMSRKVSQRNVQGYLTVLAEMHRLRQGHPEFTEVIDLWFRYIVDPIVWKAHVLPVGKKLRLCLQWWPYRRYIRGRTWVAFLLKR